MNPFPLISVIVPVYNVARYLPACVDSILAQNHSNLELILVNDGSTDDSRKVCDEYEKKDLRITVVHKNNGGTSTARNAGLNICRGAYVSFIDSDDLVHPAFLERLYNSMGDSDMSMCGYLEFFNEEELNELVVEKSPIQKFSADELLTMRKGGYNNPSTTIISVNKLYKRDLWEKIRFPEDSFTEDIFVSHHIIGEAQSISFINQPLYFYRQVETSKTKRKENIIIRKEDALKANNDRRLFAQKRNNKKLERIAISDMIEVCLSAIEEVDKKQLPPVFPETMKEYISQATPKQKLKWFLINNVAGGMTVARKVNKVLRQGW